MKAFFILLLSFSAFAQTGIEALGTDTLNESQAQPTTLGTIAKIEQKIIEGVKMKCDPKIGCAFFVDEGKGFEIKLTVSFGEGPNYSSGSSSGINIYGSNSSNKYSGIAITGVYSNFRCTRYVPEATFVLIEEYQRLMSSNEYVSRVFAAWKKGEDMPTPDAVKTALSVLATIKPSQSNCGQRSNP